MKKIKRNNIKYYRRSRKIRETVKIMKDYRKYNRKKIKIRKINHEGRDLLGIYNYICGIKEFKRRKKRLKSLKRYKTIILFGYTYPCRSKRERAIKIGNKVYTNNQMIKRFFSA